MSRTLRAFGLAWLCLAGACSRPSTSDSGSEASARVTPPPAPAPPPALVPEAPSAGPSAATVLTPEDVEDAAEHRITEQNLESELDRLEREIQAE